MLNGSLQSGCQRLRVVEPIGAADEIISEFVREFGGFPVGDPVLGDESRQERTIDPSGDVVIRRHRLLKTQGTVLRFDGEDENGASRVWVRWRHSTTLPNPSLEPVNDLEVVPSASS